MVINIALRFILEVCVLGFLTYWGFQSSQGILMKLVLGIGSPLLIAIIWGVFGSPAAPNTSPWNSSNITRIINFWLSNISFIFFRKTNSSNDLRNFSGGKSYSDIHMGSMNKIYFDTQEDRHQLHKSLGYLFSSLLLHSLCPLYLPKRYLCNSLLILYNVSIN